MDASPEVFDALKLAEFSDIQARALVTSISRAVEIHAGNQRKIIDSKVDLTRHESDLQNMESALHKDIEKLGTRLDQGMAHLESKIENLEARMDLKIDAKLSTAKFEIVRWMFIFWAGQIAAMKWLK